MRSTFSTAPKKKRISDLLHFSKLWLFDSAYKYFFTWFEKLFSHIKFNWICCVLYVHELNRINDINGNQSEFKSPYFYLFYHYYRIFGWKEYHRTSVWAFFYLWWSNPVLNNTWNKRSIYVQNHKTVLFIITRTLYSLFRKYFNNH